MLLRDAWHTAAWADKVGAEQPLARRICNKPIAPAPATSEKVWHVLRSMRD